MRKVIPLLLFSAVIVAISLSGCDNKVTEEETTDVNEKIIATIDKSLPVTKGNLITKTNTDVDGNIAINYYDSVGNLVESYLWSEDDEILSHSIITYTPDNNVQQKEEIAPDGSSTSVESYQYDNNGDLKTKTINEFNDGKLSKSTSYSADGEITGYSLSEYSEEGLLEKIERFDNSNKLCEYYTYEYNDFGQTIKYSSFNSEHNLICYTLFDYNKKGLLETEKYYNSENKLENYYLFTYYDNGSIQSSASYDSQGNLLSEDYFEKTEE